MGSSDWTESWLSSGIKKGDTARIGECCGDQRSKNVFQPLIIFHNNLHRSADWSAIVT